MTDTNVFVYGTLRRGECNNALLASARFLGTHITAPSYTLLDLGWYPGAVAGGRHAIVGEVYRISPAILARLDELEEYPQLYTREPIPTVYGDAWIYLYLHGTYEDPVIESGDWLRRAV